ncbi:class I SAM-dependent methyltransferase [Thioalkalivibrio paradoxus]|uniref:SAM-dependent methyltransferase n=1 Tax=Thioalkalivibrio paradoxus ARh 1 TaxID=713585 RepID=W0DLI3_9GAMM|nr:class I SAM-dependent methyltransferase [Thioalkalivibrio paradoxus]AHE97730.1 SAM-dependent methyltransferase [Thioalkalivibrio paradoxus ARh 1]
MWDQRYGTDEYVYGTEPNEFLREVIAEVIADLPRQGRALCLAEGEGRNAVYLAEQGFEVHAVDASPVGLAKAVRLAAQRGVHIETEVADLDGYRIEPSAWDVIVSVFCHLPAKVRQDLHRQVVQGLRPGGRLILEAYTPAQLALGTGGPPDISLMMTLDELRSELAGLEFEHARECEREVHEGRLHTGRGAVVQLVAIRR